MEPTIEIEQTTTFKEFNKQVKNQFDKMCQTGKLFRAKISGSDLWKEYLNNFENNKIFRDPESSEHNCNCCNNFIRRYGNIVSINEDGEIETLFSNITNAGDYQKPSIALNTLISSSGIGDVFFESYDMLNHKLNYESVSQDQETYQLGIRRNLKKYTQEEVDIFGVVNTNEVYEFNHFHVNLPKQFVKFGPNSIESIQGTYRDKYSVFKRCIEEIPVDTLRLVKDLINQESLLDGTSHLHSIKDMITQLKNWNSVSMDKDVYCWYASYSMDERTAKFRNTLIGVLCTELAEGMELNKACLNWNKRVDPANYHKATAPITKNQIKQAEKFVNDNGYTESFNRRLATIDDIKVEEILHSNVGDAKIKTASIFDNVKPTSTRHKRAEFDKLESVSIEKFMKDILPNCTSVEAYFENRMENNLVALTKAMSDESKSIFKWNNNYSWTFNGNLAGKSQIKQAVKGAGGSVTGVLRFSIMWAENNGDNSDLDAHCRESKGEHICFSHKCSRITGGKLDVDITNPQTQMSSGAVENITYPSVRKMSNGDYKFYVNQFSGRNSQGFKAEIEVDGEIYSYEYKTPVKGNVNVATVNLRDGQFTIKHHLPEKNYSKEVWNLETNNFYKVNLVCLSPNHWGNNNFGNKHYLFMLDDCRAEGVIRGFHNENLTPDLLKHKKVMEVIGATNMITPDSKHLAGLGFNATVNDELVVKVQGSFKRMLKIKF